MKSSFFFLILATLFLFSCSENHRSYMQEKAAEYRCMDLAKNVDGLHWHEHMWDNDDFVVIDSRIKGPYLVFSEGYKNVTCMNYGLYERYTYEKFEAYLDDVESLIGR